MRSSFFNLSTDKTKTKHPREVYEHFPTYKLPNDVDSAYLRGVYLEKQKD